MNAGESQAADGGKCWWVPRGSRQAHSAASPQRAGGFRTLEWLTAGPGRATQVAAGWAGPTMWGGCEQAQVQGT